LDIGVLVSSVSPASLDCFRIAGLDFVWLDAELTALMPRDCYEAVSHLAGSQIDVLVRVPSSDQRCIQEYANTGAAEIVVPRVRTAEEIELALLALRYPPRGSRPRQLGPSARFGFQYEWESHTRLSVILETTEAYERHRELLSIDGLYGAWIGARDLQDDADRRGWGDVKGHVREMDRAMRSSSCVSGSVAFDREQLDRCVTAGSDRCAIYWEPYIVQHLDQLQQLAHGVAFPPDRDSQQ
jgi:4-hydroxy-2-oxoheptanedioate aldolase